MYTLIKKLGKTALLVGIALIICGVISGMTLSDFEKNSARTTAYITNIEEGGSMSNGYKLTLRYTVDGERYDGKITSGNLGTEFEKIELKAKNKGMDVIDYIDTVSNDQKTVSILYNKEIPKSIKAVDYKEQGNDFYTWGFIVAGGSLALLVVNSVMKKKREERAAERRVEKKMAKQAKKQQG